MTDQPAATLSEQERSTLLQIARQAIAHELYQYVALDVDPEQYPPSLRQLRGTFVTLQLDGQLRGCIGTLEAVRPLVVDVARNAGAAAFADPRFMRLSQQEFQGIEIHISILSPAEPISFASEADLLSQLRPGIDGLILIEGPHRGTFLPAVWQQIPEPQQFLTHLKTKAGLASDYWSDTIQFQRYTTESF